MKPNTPASRHHRASLMLVLLTVSMGVLLSGCTIIRYVDPPGNNDPGVQEPKLVDVLVLVDLDRGAANLTEHYGNVLGGMVWAMAERNIEVRHAAMAPLYHRADTVVPLLYGEGDPNSQFYSFAEAIAFYTYDDGTQYLQGRADIDGENLAALGLDLGRRAIYRPTMADPTARPYFEEPADGFVVIYLTASPRPCAASEEACKLNGLKPSNYFVEADGDGHARWLDLPGEEGIAPNRIFHLAVVTAEGLNYDQFEDTCSKLPGFPIGALDVMEPSAKSYYGPLTEEIRRNGGRAANVDLCRAMSSLAPEVARGVAAQIRAMF